MAVTFLEVFHYPPGEDWRSVKIENPDLEQIELSIDRLDRKEWPFVWLHTESPIEGEMPNNMLCVMGGRDEYSLVLTLDGDEIEFTDPSRNQNTVRIWESDQGAERSSSQLCNDKIVVLQIVKLFCESNKLDTRFEWRTI